MIGEVPNSEPESKELSDYIGQVDVARSELFEGIGLYIESPSPKAVELLTVHCTKSALVFGAAIRHIIELDEPADVKARLTLSLQRTENSTRVKAINELLGVDKVDETEFGCTLLSEDETFLAVDEDDIDPDIWYNSEVDAYGTALGNDINGFIYHVDALKDTRFNRFKAAALDKAKEVSTLAGGVAIGILIAKPIGEFMEQQLKKK